MRLIPGIPYGPQPRAQAYAGALAWPPKLVVVHATDNPTSNAAGEARYAATRTDPQGNWTSCHVYVDTTGPLGSLPLDYRAWSAYGWANANGIHVELCGVSGRVPEAVQRAGAAIVRQLCQLTGVPMRHLDGPAVRRLHDSGGTGGVTGHGDITAADFDDNDHTDPGFTPADWARFMGWVTAQQQEDDMALEGLDRAQVNNSERYLQSMFGLLDKAVGISDTVHERDLPSPFVAAFKQLTADVAELKARPATTVELTPEALAALGPVVEAAVRKVLGGLDGATPPDAGVGRA